MQLEYLAILEKRVQEMIEMIKILRNEKHSLERLLREEARCTQALREERNEVRGRIEKVLSTLKHVNENGAPAPMERETEQATSY